MSGTFNPNTALDFYAEQYDIVGNWIVKHGTPAVTFGETRNRRCRFCSLRPPEATFRLQAHAIPESLGNRTLFSAHECDACNQAFGRGIENEFGNWSKPLRTFARIKGKSGIPTIKKGGDGGWRLEFDTDGLQVTQGEDNPVMEVNKDAKTLTFRLRRDPYIPEAVLKAFVKMGLSLIPDENLPDFGTALAWVADPYHSKPLGSEGIVLATFLPGPTARDTISLVVLRRKDDYLRLPFVIFVLCYGNELFQVALPSPEKNWALVGTQVELPPFPHPIDLASSPHGQPYRYYPNLLGNAVVRDEEVTITMRYDAAINRS
jgi:hypothetical protein